VSGDDRIGTEGDGYDDDLYGGHGHDDRDVHLGPERDTQRGRRGESARAGEEVRGHDEHDHGDADTADVSIDPEQIAQETADESADQQTAGKQGDAQDDHARRSEEYTSELQSRFDLVCRLLLEKKKQ